VAFAAATAYACCQEPIASFTASPGNVVICQQVSFDASASEDPDGTTLTYSWDFGDGETGTGKITTHRYRCTGTKTVKLTVIDNDNPDCCNGDPNCTDKSDTDTKYVTVSLPDGCSTGSKSANLQVQETGGADCGDPYPCGDTDPWDNLGINIFARYNDCKWVFQVTAVVDCASDPCPGNFIAITDGNDPDLTQANYCAIVDNFWNDNGCAVVGGNQYSNATCIEIHEDKHFQLFYDRATGYEEDLLLQKISMSDMTIDCGNSNTTTCQAAKNAREAAITADVQNAYDSAYVWMYNQGEAPAVEAARLCFRELAELICKYAFAKGWPECDACP